MPGFFREAGKPLGSNRPPPLVIVSLFGFESPGTSRTCVPGPVGGLRDLRGAQSAVLDAFVC
jgi:hypothetical protein